MEIAEIINDIKNEIDAIEFNVANIDMTENLKRTKNSHLFFLKEVVSRLESLSQPTGVEVWVS